MLTNKLDEQLITQILAFLDVKTAVTSTSLNTSPTLATLEKLLAAYYRTVPWESVFRIVRKAKPVDDATYRAATENDYGASGLFLEFVIINKVINNQAWRFNMAERPWLLNRFEWGKRFDTVLTGDVATGVALHFGMDTAVVQRAFALTQHNYPNEGFATENTE